MIILELLIFFCLMVQAMFKKQHNSYLSLIHTSLLFMELSMLFCFSLRLYLQKSKVSIFKSLSVFSKRCRKIFGLTCHGPHAIFKKHSLMQNNNVHIGFIKISECSMAGELIYLLRLLRLRDILHATIASKEFQDSRAKTFQ